MNMHVTPLEKARRSFNEATSGQFRGRESFCRILETASLLSLAGFNRESEAAYLSINSTKEEFECLLRTTYRRAALENYQDSTDARFKGSGRAIQESLSDLHLVPAYMEMGGLDPKREDSWLECGIDHADYIAVYNARRIDEALRTWNLAQHQNCTPASHRAMHKDILNLLTNAGKDIAQEETYNILQITKKDFEGFFRKQSQRTLNLQRSFID